jgi:hypothetical protein
MAANGTKRKSIDSNDVTTSIDGGEKKRSVSNAGAVVIPTTMKALVKSTPTEGN